MLFLQSIKKVFCASPIQTFFCVIMTLLFSIVTYLELAITQEIVKELENKNINGIIFMSAIMLLLYISRNIYGTIKQLLMAKIQLRISNKYYKELYNSIYFNNLTKLDKASYLLDIKLARQAIEADLLNVFNIFTEIIGALSSVCIISVRLFDINSAFLIIFFVMAFLQSIYVIKYSKSSMKIIQETAPLERKHQYYFSLLHQREYVKEIRSYKLNNWIENKRHNEYSKMMKKQLGFSKKWLIVNGIWTLLMFGCELILYLCFLYYKLRGTISLDQITFVIQSNSLFLQSFIGVIDQIGLFYQKTININALNKLLYPQPEEIEKNKVCCDDDYVLRLQKLSFSYDDKEVIKNINFNMKKGETIVVVGKNGSGKSTFVKVIAGILKKKNGEIIYGTDKISIVFQDFAKFKFSLRENIGFGNLSFIMDNIRIENALHKAGGIELLEKFRGDLDIELGKEFGENAQDLSGGEWQKIAIARAMFKEGDLLIFDEPTASLDPLAERKQMNIIKNAFNNKSLIIISHRIGIAKLADRIVYLDEGHISELGTFDELMEKKGKFYQLFIQQSRWYADDEMERWTDEG